MLRQCSKHFGKSLLRNRATAVTALQTRNFKEDTGIVGLPVDPDARKNLRSQIHEVLSALKVIPETAYYRQQVEATMQYRLKAVNSPATDEEVEEQLENQLESLIRHCRDELRLIPKMAEWQPWDVPADHDVDVLIEEEVQPPPPPETPGTTGPPPPKK